MWHFMELVVGIYKEDLRRGSSNITPEGLVTALTDSDRQMNRIKTLMILRTCLGLDATQNRKTQRRKR